MNNHRSNIVGHGEAWQAKCSCGWRSGIVTRSEANDLQYLHLNHAKRAHAGLRKKQPSIEETLAWYSQQAADTANTAEEREQWRKLAEELRPRAEGQSLHDTPLWE